MAKSKKTASKKLPKKAKPVPNERPSPLVESAGDPNAQSDSESSTPYTITIRLYSRDAKEGVYRRITRSCSDKADYPMVANWNYIVSKRLRLTTNMSSTGSGVQDLEALVARFLSPGEDSEAFVQDLARADVIEVSVPYVLENVGWAARLFPWENALSIITRRHRKRSLAVVRHLDAAAKPKVAGNPQSALVIRSTPGDIKDSFDFRSESALVKFRLGFSDNQLLDIDTPTFAEAMRAVADGKPDLIHLAVLDTFGITQLRPELLQGAWSSLHAEQTSRAGIILRGESLPYHALSPAETGALVTANGAHQPILVSFATCFSATRLAPLAVAAGAGAAIGFHEGLLNSLSESFFGEFYSSWRQEDWDLLKAFQSALKVLRGQPESGRSGVALWSATSLVENRVERNVVKTQTTATAPAEASTPLIVDQNTLRRMFTVACEPLRKVNYCSLHNGRDLFSEFSIKKTEPGLAQPIEVRVELTAENEMALWRQSFTFGESPGTESLKSRVRVPLGARALRRVQESTRSSLFVDVRCNSHVLFQQSSEVTLLPVDEWRDTDDDRRWLPSFVLPRDPSVRQIMSAADRYLRALSDNSGAGFDGYQQALDSSDVVDLQARAIWCALLYDFRLRYINPPPTYTKTETGLAQRLRTPSQILEEGRGTCIDLALLFASCLEYVGIYPVILLISGHAFPGWWRTEQAFQSFAGFKYVDVAEGKAAELAKRPVARDEFAQWMVTGNTGFRELVGPLREGTLAALETTLVCANGGFEEALQQGRENLTDAAIFDALIDVQRAREGENPVTPLPIVDGWIGPSTPQDSRS